MKAVLSNLVAKLAGTNETKPIDPNELVILFHKDCNGHIEHGSIYADHAMHNLKNYPVRFAFKDVNPPPVMTAKLLANIEEQALRQGYVVYGLRSYSEVMTVHPRPEKMLVGEPQRQGNRQSISRPMRRPHDEPRHKDVGQAGIPKRAAAA
jgi:hypothetical protein